MPVPSALGLCVEPYGGAPVPTKNCLFCLPQSWGTCKCKPCWPAEPGNRGPCPHAVATAMGHGFQGDTSNLKRVSWSRAAVCRLPWSPWRVTVCPRCVNDRKLHFQSSAFQLCRYTPFRKDWETSVLPAPCALSPRGLAGCELRLRMLHPVGLVKISPAGSQNLLVWGLVPQVAAQKLGCRCV